MNDALYNKLKFLAQILLPALATLYFTMAGIWGLPFAEEVVGTIVALDTFLGVVLHISSAAYSDGDLVIEETPAGKTFTLELKNDPEYELEGKDQILFKVKKVSGGALTPDPGNSQS